MRGEDALQAAVVGGSQQQRLYRIARRDGASIEDACVASGILASEAALIEREDAKNPPPPEAYELLAVSAEPEAAGCAATTNEGIIMPKHDNTDDIEPNDPLIDLAADTLRGDVRDSLLSWFKAAPKAWPFMSEREQRDLADAADRYAEQMVKQACEIIAAGERPCIVAKLVEYKEKDGVEAKLKLASKGEIVAQLHEACGREVLIVTTGADEFLGEGEGPIIDADEPGIPGIGDEYDEAA
jgi:hypothetical protein